MVMNSTFHRFVKEFLLNIIFIFMIDSTYFLLKVFLPLRAVASLWLSVKEIQRTQGIQATNNSFYYIPLID